MMARCYVPPERWDGESLRLDEDEAHHLSHVLRAEVGHRVIAFDGRGRESEAEISVIERDRVELRELQRREIRRTRVEFTIIQALPREQKMDFILQKATELGASAIVPVISDHGVVRLRDGDEAKRERWEKIVLNAAKQSGAAWLPVVHPVRHLHDALKDVPAYDVLLICSLEPDARPLRDVLAEVKARAPRTLAVLVGPEGDFSVRELAAARQAGARPVSLGPSVLRVETATLFVLSVLRYELDGAGSPR